MNILEITTNMGCINDCACCPQDTLLKAYGTRKRMFTLEDYSTCLHRLEPCTTDIGFCGFSEPFLNPICSDMIRLSSVLGFHLRLLTTLRGFQEKDIAKLQGLNIHYIKIHVPDKTQFVMDTDAWIRMHKTFWRAEIPADYDHMTMGDVDPRIIDYLKSCGIGHIIHPPMSSRAGTVHDRPALTGNIFCSQNRWHYNVLLPNGDVYLCCMDFGLKHRLGNLIEQPYSEIYAEAERLMISDHSTMICAKCDWAVNRSWYNPFGKPRFK